MFEKILVGTFVRQPHVSSTLLKSIIETFNVNTIFIFDTDDVDYRRLVTFNTDGVMSESYADYKRKNRNTIQLHRRKQTNTFYTINSLNKLIEIQGGKSNKNFEVDWSEYSNSCLLIDDKDQLKKVSTRLIKVVDFK